MTEQPPLANQPVRPALNRAGREQRWLRLAALVLLAQITLFYQGCDNKRVIHSLGPAGPWLTVGVDESLPSSQLIDFSPGLFGLNLLVIAAFGVLVTQLSQPWFERLTSRRLLAAAAIATLIFNSVLYFAAAWVFLVGYPIVWLAYSFFSGLSIRPDVLHGGLSRAYYLLCIAVIAGALRLVQWLLRRYLFIHDDRWQVSLGGSLALMAVLGTGIGMLLRLIAN